MDLRSCYFCGTVGDALDTHALPSADAADPVRVTLCTDCHAKLDRVLDAVASEPAERDESQAADAPSSAADATFRGTGEVTFGDPDSSAADAEADGDEPDDAAATGSSTPAGSDGIAPGEDATDRDEAETGRDGEEQPERGDAVADGEAADTAAATAERAPDDAPDAEHADGESAATGGGLRGLDPDDRGRVATYRKALRLLQNREFPMERAAVVDLLGSAYDLDRTECDTLLDFAVEKGLLVEEGEELRRP